MLHRSKPLFQDFNLIFLHSLFNLQIFTSSVLKTHPIILRQWFDIRTVHWKTDTWRLVFFRLLLKTLEWFRPNNRNRLITFVTGYVYQTYFCVEGNNGHCRTKRDFNKANTYLGNRNRSILRVLEGSETRKILALRKFPPCRSTSLLIILIDFSNFLYSAYAA